MARLLDQLVDAIERSGRTRYDIATQLPIEPVPFVSEQHHLPQNYAFKSCDFFWLTVQEKKTCSDFAGGFPVTADEVTITVYGADGTMVCTRKKIKIDDKSINKSFSQS